MAQNLYDERSFAPRLYRVWFVDFTDGDRQREWWMKQGSWTVPLDRRGGGPLYRSTIILTRLHRDLNNTFRDHTKRDEYKFGLLLAPLDDDGNEIEGRREFWRPTMPIDETDGEVWKLWQSAA